MAKGQTSTTRQNVTLSHKTKAYLAALAGMGTHGDSVSDVAKTLIEQGIREAIQNGFLKLSPSGVE